VDQPRLARASEVLHDGVYETLPPALQRNLARLRRVHKIQGRIAEFEEKQPSS